MTVGGSVVTARAHPLAGTALLQLHPERTAPEAGAPALAAAVDPADRSAGGGWPAAVLRFWFGGGLPEEALFFVSEPEERDGERDAAVMHRLALLYTGKRYGSRLMAVQSDSAALV
jgi:hypothetical protein